MLVSLLYVFQSQVSLFICIFDFEICIVSSSSKPESRLDFRSLPNLQYHVGWRNAGMISCRFVLRNFLIILSSDVRGHGRSMVYSDTIFKAYPESIPLYHSIAIATWEIMEKISLHIRGGINMLKYMKSYALRYKEFLLIPYDKYYLFAYFICEIYIFYIDKSKIGEY